MVIYDNQFKYIVRSHEVVMDGFESMSPYVKVLFSSTDYCGKT